MFKSIDLRKHLIGILAVLGCLVWLANVTNYNLAQRQPIKEVDVSGAKALIDGGALVIDVRGDHQFKLRRIPGAILISLEELQTAIPARLLAVAKDRQIVVYCNQGLHHGPEGTAILNRAGYVNAVNLKDGIEGWQGAGQKIGKG